MPTLKINGQSVEVEEGTTVLQACLKRGILVPHYCYHPGLSIAGNCRICMVEINGRTTISCNTVCSEGMEVETNSEKAQQARKATMEFLLLNHPLDCPVCDQAGDCKLQDFYIQFSRHKSRQPLEQKVRKAKRKPISENIYLDQERCILCSRCVRFCEEITKTYELGIFQRGDGSVLDVVPGQEVNNDYSGCLVDICPVGALLDRKFRYTMSAWFLKRTPSICPHCERGCNIEIHHNTTHYPRRKQRVFRIKPRVNLEVNGYWICDEGRYSYPEIDEKRQLDVLIKNNDQLTTITWKEAFEKLLWLLKEKRGKVLLTTFLSNEELYLARKLFEQRNWEIGCATFDDEAFEDRLLKKKNRTPNKKFAEWLKLPFVEPKAFLKDASCAMIFHPHLLVDLPVPETTVFFATHQTPHLQKAWLILPVAVYAEKEGSFTNFQGKVQRFSQAVPPLGMAKPEWEVLRDLFILLDLPQPDLSFPALQKRVTEAFQGQARQ